MALDYEYSPSRDRGSCSTIVVGKDASATGYVLVAHNEDDYDCVLQVHKVPRIRHKPGETIRFADAKGVIPQVEEETGSRLGVHRLLQRKKIPVGIRKYHNAHDDFPLLPDGSNPDLLSPIIPCHPGKDKGAQLLVRG